jgi:signal transduction histidine kinase
MKHYITLLFVFFCLLPILHARATDDPAPHNDPTTAANINEMVDAAKQHARKNPSQAVEMLKSIRQFAINSITNNTKKNIFNIERTIAQTYEQNNQIDTAIVYFKIALETVPDYLKEKNTTFIYIDLAHCYRKIGKYTDSKHFLEKALELAQANHEADGIEYAYHGFGQLYEEIGEYEKTVEYYLKSMHYAEDRANTSDIVNSLQYLAKTYLKLKNTDLAISTIEKASLMAINVKDTIVTGTVLFDYGVILSEMGKPNEALAKLQTSLIYFKALNYKPLMARSLFYIADVYTNKGDYITAQQYFLDCVKYKEFISLRSHADLYNKLGELYIKKNNQKAAENAFLQSLDLAVQHNFKDIAQKNNYSLYKIYNTEGKIALALQALEKATTLRDSLLNESKSKGVAELQFKYDLEKTERKIQDLNWQKRRTLFTTSVVGFLAVIGFLLYVYRTKSEHNLSLAQKNQQIEEQNRNLLASNEVLQQFAYVAAHDLKEPLRNIGSFVSLIQRRYGKQLNEEANEYMNFVKEGVKKMNNLLTDLLEYSTIYHQQHIEEDKIDVKQTIESVCANLRATIQEKQAIIEYGNMPAVTMNKSHLSQIFQNLIGNALKFSKEAPHIRISGEEKNHTIIYSVADNGIGINKDYADKVFKLFHRLHKDQGYEGTGIGLTICKNILQKYNGDIWFESEGGKGTTFFIRIPIENHAKIAQNEAMTTGNSTSVA